MQGIARSSGHQKADNCIYYLSLCCRRSSTPWKTKKNCWQHVELANWVSLSNPHHYLQLSHVIGCWKNKIEHEPCSPGSLLAMRPCLLSKVVTLSVLPSHRFFEVNLNPCHQLVVRGAKHLGLSTCPRANCQGWYKLFALLPCLQISRISFESWTCRASQRNEKNVLRTLNCRSGSWQGAARRVSFCSCICASFQAWKCKIRRQRLQLHWPVFYVLNEFGSWAADDLHVLDWMHPWLRTSCIREGLRSEFWICKQRMANAPNSFEFRLPISCDDANWPYPIDHPLALIFFWTHCWSLMYI